jgi:hypothetical protein
MRCCPAPRFCCIGCSEAILHSGLGISWSTQRTVRAQARVPLLNGTRDLGTECCGMRLQCCAASSRGSGSTGPTAPSSCPEGCEHTGWSLPASSCAGTAAWPPASGACPHRTGRPPVSVEIAALIERSATEVTRESRAKGELLKARPPSRHVYDPLGPQSAEDSPGAGAALRHDVAEVLHTQASTMLATDFYVNCAVTLQRLRCLFVIEIGSRYVHIFRSPRTRTGPGPCSRSATC